MSIVWPCPLTVDAYASMGRAVQVPRPDCPSCLVPAVFWSGYWRYIRWQGQERKIFIRRVRCRACGVTYALLPAFTLARRLDAADTAGVVIGQVVAGACGVRPAAAAAGVPHTTARGWVRRFAARAGELAVSFSALAVELGGEAVRLLLDPLRSAVAAIGAAFTAAAGLPGWAVLGRWRFACAVTGGSLLAVNASSPFLIIGRRRFMPPRSS
jgi:transposase-like protein